MSVCGQHGLYDAVIYVYNNGMLDYTTPAEDLLHIMAEAQTNGMLTQKQIHLGNKLLVYISCCLAGRAYPYGDVPNDMVAKVKYDVYSCLTAPMSKRNPQTANNPDPGLATNSIFVCFLFVKNH